MEENNLKLNILYDEWDICENKPKITGEEIFDKNNLRNILNLMSFYEFNNIKSCSFNEINQNENYFYFINHTNSINELLNNINSLSHPIFEKINITKNVYLVFLTEHETINSNQFIILNKFCAANKLNTKQIILINNNPLLEEYKKTFNSNIKVKKLNFLDKCTSLNLKKFDNEFKRIEDKEGKFFLCHNRVPKVHRYVILMYLKKYNLLENVDWSLILGKEFIKKYYNEKFYDILLTKQELDEFSEVINYLNDIEIKKSDYEENKKWFDNSQLPWDEIFELKTFENSYVNITTESEYFSDSIHVTEKSLKPFYFHQLPIILASKNHVKFMKENYKLDFFDDIINHDYDNEWDPRKRIKKVISEILRLQENKSLIIQFYKNNTQRFLNNRKIIQNLNNKVDCDYFESLICI
jgi:hypothetical protein